MTSYAFYLTWNHVILNFGKYRVWTRVDGKSAGLPIFHKPCRGERALLISRTSLVCTFVDRDNYPVTGRYSIPLTWRAPANEQIFYTERAYRLLDKKLWVWFVVMPFVYVVPTLLNETHPDTRALNLAGALHSVLVKYRVEDFLANRVGVSIFAS